MKTKLLLVCSMSFMLCAASMAQQKDSVSHQIHWRGYSFSTSQPFTGLIPALQITAYPEDEQKGYYFVQFSGPITSDLKKTVMEAGAELLNYVPHNAYLVRMSSPERRIVSQLPDVRWVGIYQPAMRISNTLINKLTVKEGEESIRQKELEFSPKTLIPGENTLQLVVVVFEGEDLSKIKSEIEQVGAEIFKVSDENNTKILISIPKEHALRLASINGIKWIEEYHLPALYNDVARGLMGIPPVWNSHGLKGDGQIIAIADGGIDSGFDDASMHGDFEGRIQAIFSWPVLAFNGIINPGADDGAADLDDGHGTHVAGSALGNGIASGGIYKGAAPKASLVFQAMEQEVHLIPQYAEGNGYYLNAIPLDLNDLFQQAYDSDARIHSNSWGGGNPGEYNYFSEDVDEFVWENPDMLILCATGNSGSDGDGDNVINKGGVTGPATAKNCLAVGASENNRPGLHQTWSVRHGSIFNSDFRANNPDGMAAKSNRGLANSNTPNLGDDIIKPDVVAPGTMIVSARSQATANTVWFMDNMESGVNGWTTTGTWERVTSEAHSLSTSWHDSPGGDYADGADMSLECPAQNISGGGQGTKFLQFWYKCELGDGDYVNLILEGDDHEFKILLATGTQAEWQLFTRPLGPFFHSGFNTYWNWSDDANLQFSFQLVSNNDGDTGDGFYIDDIRIVEGAYTTARLSDFGLATAGSPMDENYLVMEGTSMATPLVAGAAAIVRQYYTEFLNIDYVSAALLRATLINGSVDISPGQYGTGATLEIEPRPDSVQGWGRVNLENSIFPVAPASLSHMDELAGLETNEYHTYSYTVTDVATPLVITMVYHDFPGVGLVNHLDMTVNTPSAATLFPNGRTSVDNQNNVEQIAISVPETGTYTIQIHGKNVPQGPQPYAIAISGAGYLLDRDPVAVMLALDFSGSMLSPACPTCDQKLKVLKDAVELFIVLWSTVAVPGDLVGVNYFKTNVSNLTFGSDVLVQVIGNTDAIISDVQNKSNTYSDLTAMGGGLQSAINTLSDESRPRSIILFTDGMQNVNPMVVRTDDSPPPDAFYLDIDEVSGKPPSNISPSDPVTTLDEDLGIKINTIGVGASPPYIERLSNIADKTLGLTKITTDPDNDLRRFYVEELVDVLRDYSPQLLGYRYGTLSGGTATETFQVNEGVGKLILKCSWRHDAKLSFTVSKYGTNVPLNDATVYGPYYQVFVLDFTKDTTWTSGGEWTMHISGSAGASYEVAAIVDEHQLDCEYSIGAQNQTVGEPLKLQVRLKYDRNPITDARVKARILKPKIGLGTLLSTSKAPATVPDKFRPEAQSTPGQLKLQKLLSVNAFQQSLRPLETVVELTNNGDGSYSNTFNDTKLNGVYRVVFDIEGTHGVSGEYRRTESFSTMFSYGNTVLSESGFFKRLEDETGLGKIYLIHISPIDAYGNYLGPDYGDYIHVIPSSLQRGDIIDETDGTYKIPVMILTGEDPKISIIIKGDTVFNDQFSQIPDPVEDRIKLSVHGGWAYPLGTLASQYSSGYLVELDLEYMLQPNLSLEALIGRYAFGNNYNITGGALYLKGYFPIKNQSKGYGAFGAGAYKPDNVNTSFGLSGGLGFIGNISPKILYDFGVYYYNVFAPSSSDLNWMGLRAGIKYTF